MGQGSNGYVLFVNADTLSAHSNCVVLGALIAGLGPRILTWNSQLTAYALAFSSQNTDASMLVSFLHLAGSFG